MGTTIQRPLTPNDVPALAAERNLMGAVGIEGPSTKFVFFASFDGISTFDATKK